MRSIEIGIGIGGIDNEEDTIFDMEFNRIEIEDIYIAGSSDKEEGKVGMFFIIKTFEASKGDSGFEDVLKEEMVTEGTMEISWNGIRFHRDYRKGISLRILSSI